MIEQIKFSSLLGLSRPNRSSTTRPNHLMTTRFRPKPKVLSVGDEFPFSKTDTVGSSGGFASPKPDQPKPDWSYKKIRPNLAKIGQIRLYLVGFSQIRPNPTISSEKKKHISEKIQFPATFSSFRRKFQIPATIFLQISMPFLIPAPDPTRPTLTITENRTDRFFRRSVSGYSAPLPDAGGSSPGWVENRPGPTRGQP